MNAHDILILYKAMVEAATELLSAAKDQDWEKFASLTKLIEEKAIALQDGDVGMTMNEEESKEKKYLIEMFLGIDRQVKSVVASEMATLEKMINSASKRDEVNQRYGSLRTQ